MAKELFRRSCFAIVGDTRVDGLRMRFKIEKNDKNEPNKVELNIYNLSPSTRAKMQTKGAPLVISAGYPDNEAIVFSGDVRSVDHVRTGPDWVTKIQAGDGERNYVFARFVASFSPGTSVATVIRACVKATAMNPGNLDAVLASGKFSAGYKTFTHGYSVADRAVDVLSKLMKSAGFSTHWEGNKLRFTPIKPSREDFSESRIVLSPPSGLIGSPEHGTPDKKTKVSKIKAKALLQPQLHIHGLVEVRAESTNGVYYITDITHTGDTHSGDWYTEMELVNT